MHNLARAIMRTDDAIDPIQLHGERWTRKGISLRRAEVSMIAAGPGGGKSSIALWAALTCTVRDADGTHRPARVLYVCADTGWHTIALRTGQMILNHAYINARGVKEAHTGPQVEAYIKENKTWFSDIIAAGADHITWEFNSSPTTDDIRALMDAYVEMHGAFPELVVVDNLSDVDHDAEVEAVGMKANMKTLSQHAYDTKAAVLVLHHIREGGSYDGAPPMSAVTGKVNQKAALVMTLHYEHDSKVLRVCAVKNRYGGADPDGNNYFTITWDAALMRYSDTD